jgi:hypothetical protein
MSYMPDQGYNTEGIVNILANYPWQQYDYKYGRWQRKPVLHGYEFVCPWWKSWEEEYGRVVLLTHSTQGNAIAEMTGMVMLAEKPSGRLLFAGDPNYAGVISIVVKGERHVFIVGSTRLDYGRGVTIPEIARDLTKIMVPGQPPNVRLREPAGINHKDLGPWIADHPEKPPKGVWPHQETQLRGQ